LISHSIAVAFLFAACVTIVAGIDAVVRGTISHDPWATSGGFSLMGAGALAALPALYALYQMRGPWKQRSPMPSDSERRAKMEAEFHELLSTKRLVELFCRYHTLPQRHANMSFAISCLALATGTVLMAWGVSLAYDGKTQVSLLTGVSGIIMNIISGGFFVLHRRTLDQVRESRPELARIQSQMWSFVAAEKISRSDVRDKVLQFVAKKLLEESEPYNIQEIRWMFDSLRKKIDEMNGNFKTRPANVPDAPESPRMSTLPDPAAGTRTNGEATGE
jgi:hypothetical protein